MKYLPLLLLVALMILLALAGCVSATDPTQRPQAFTVRVCDSLACFDTLVMVKP